MWGCIWCSSFRSLTVLWSYVLAAGAVIMEARAQFPDVATSVGLAQYVPPNWLPKYTFAIAVLTLLARMRTLFRHVEHREDSDAGSVGQPFQHNPRAD